MAFNPRHYKILRLHIMGTYTRSEIANLVGCSESQVHDVVNSPFGREVLAKVEGKYMDSIMEVQTLAQLVSPECMMEKINLALKSQDEKIRSINTREILEMAGHKPDTRVILEQTATAAARELNEMSIEEIRASLVPTVH